MILNKEVDIKTFKEIKVFFSDVDGTLTDGFTYYSNKGEELKRFNHKDGRGVFLLKELKIKFGIITNENTDIVKRRAEKLKTDYCLTGITDKLKSINELCSREKISLSEIAYIGDDTNDIELMKSVGISFAVNDSVNTVKVLSNYICEQNGGYGAFRESVDFLIENFQK